MAASSPLLVLGGTYGEKLGHVDGQGKGVYAFTIDRETLAPAEGRAKFLGVAQLGGHALGRLGLHVLGRAAPLRSPSCRWWLCLVRGGRS